MKIKKKIEISFLLIASAILLFLGISSLSVSFPQQKPTVQNILSGNQLFSSYDPADTACQRCLNDFLIYTDSILTRYKDSLEAETNKYRTENSALISGQLRLFASNDSLRSIIANTTRINQSLLQTQEGQARSITFFQSLTNTLVSFLIKYK